MWLHEEFNGGMAFFPDANNHHIQLTNNRHSTISLIVEGQEECAPAAASTAPNFMVSPQTSNVAGPSRIAAVTATTPHKRSTEEPSIRVKIVHALFKHPGGKPYFTPTSQIYLAVSKQDANVFYILLKAQQSWRMTNY